MLGTGRSSVVVLGLALALATAGFAACSSDTSGTVTEGAGSATDGGGGAPSSTTSSSGKGHTTSTGSKSSSSGADGGGGGTPLDPEACHVCLDQECATEKSNCDDECYAIQGCLDAQCGNLSALGSNDEGKCQVECQARHPAGKSAHQAYVSCAIGTADCAACSSNPFDVNACRAKADGGACASALSDCTGDANCVDYQTCAAGCTTEAECVACGTGTTQEAGQTLAFAYETCIATQCLAETWLP